MAESFTVSINMGFTHPEFRRLLPKALRSEDYYEEKTANGLKFLHRLEGGKAIDIEVSEVMIRQITPLFRMPNVDVNFTFSGFSPGEVEVKMLLIRRGFQKGGG